MPPVLYRVWCQDGPRHDAVPDHRLSALVATGHLDLEDRVALQGTEEWLPAWKFDGLFEPEVVRALERNAPTCARMLRTISGGWLSLMEYRAERDRLLEREPGVPDSAWARRPRPDLARAGAVPVLRKAADEGAAAERAAEHARRRRPAAERPNEPTRPPEGDAPTPPATPVALAQPSVRALRRNVGRLLEGDLAGALDPMRVVMAWRRHGLRNGALALLVALALDPLQPMAHALQHWLVAMALASAACLLMQLASPPNDARWTDRFAACLLACLITAAVLVVGVQVDMQRGLLAHHWPDLAAWQDRLRASMQQP